VYVILAAPKALSGMAKGLRDHITPIFFVRKMVILISSRHLYSVRHLKDLMNTKQAIRRGY
jgi:hypothetical protein